MLSPEMIAVLLTAGSGLIIGGVAWGKNQDSLETIKTNIEKMQKDIDKKIDVHIIDDERMENSLKSQQQKIWEWKDEHEKAAADFRLELQKQIGKLEASLQVHESQYSEIVRMITNMSETFSKKMDQLETSIKELRK